MTRLLMIGVLAALAGAQTASKSPDPITDRLRFEIAVAQRDYVAAKAAYDIAMDRLRAKTAEAESLCHAAGKKFSQERFECMEGPKPPVKEGKK